MLPSMRVYSLRFLLLCVTVLSVGCAHPPKPTGKCSIEPCDKCLSEVPTVPKEKCEFTWPRDYLIPGVRNFAKVSPALWRGAQPTREGFCNLQAAGVKTIVNLRYDHDDLPFLAGTRLGYFWMKAHAWHPEEEDLVKFLRVLGDKNNWPVFVHCAAGSDRTGYSVATYRIVIEGWAADDAIYEMFGFGFHPWWFMNPGILRHIEEIKKDIQDKVSQLPLPLPDNAPEGARQK